MRVTIIGHGPAPAQATTGASGILVEAGATRLLLDCGQGVIGPLLERMDPRELDAIVVGHMHADHYLDVVGLRYLFPWAGEPQRRLPLHLPPRGTERLTMLASAISERPTFFEDSFEIAEYAEEVALEIGELHVVPFRARHYVPAWGMTVTDRAGRRLVYAGDTGPNDRLADVARGADLLICEASLADVSEDDGARGHMTATEALETARAAGVARTIVTHFGTALRPSVEAAIAASGVSAEAARVGLSVEV